MYIFISVIS